MYTKLPKDEDLETWEETYNRLESIITERERAYRFLILCMKSTTIMI